MINLRYESAKQVKAEPHCRREPTDKITACSHELQLLYLNFAQRVELSVSPGKYLHGRGWMGDSELRRQAQTYWETKIWLRESTARIVALSPEATA
jgi:hypothetical protein